jgi:hypothetical protein
MEINGESAGVMAAALTALAIIVKFFKYMFSKFSKIDGCEADILDLKKSLEMVKDSDVKEIRNDIRQLEKDFQELKNTVEQAIVEGNSSIEKTVSNLHIKLLEKIADMNKKNNQND